MSSPSAPVAGVDGCRGGWVVARWAGPGTVARVEVVGPFSLLVAELDAGTVEVIGVDMPIGLALDGRRDADREARKTLEHRRSSLFPTPAWATLTTMSYRDALVANRAASGVGLSKQAFHLLPKIREVRDALLDRPDRQVHEVHPETSFAVLAGAPMAHSKAMFDGATERQAHLERVGLWPVEGSASGARTDDVHDALAAAWSAHRIATGSARVMGDSAARDPDGFRLTISRVTRQSVAQIPANR